MNDGGVVYVCPGRYTTTFALSPSRALTVIGAGQGASEATDTILDAQQTGTTLLIEGTARFAVSLSRVRITGGASPVGGGFGGGMFHNGLANEADVFMTDCTVTGNTSQSSGGGILTASGRHLTMRRCTVSNNQARDRGSGGGGIEVLGPTMLTDCLIENNSSLQGGGGGIAIGGDTVLDGHTLVRHNRALGGAGIFVASGSVTIGADCRVTGNTLWDLDAPGTGAGIHNESSVTLGDIADPSPIVVDNCNLNCGGPNPVLRCALGGTCPAP